MRKFYLLSLLCFTIVMGCIGQASAEKIDYEKYGRIAMAVIKEDYTGEPITEYQFQGRDKITDTEVQDRFKFQVKENGKTIDVFVKVRHSIQNNKVLSLTVEEAK